MPATANLQIKWEGYESSSEETRKGQLQHLISLAVALGSGTSDGQIDRVYSERRSVNASTTDSIDLAGALTKAVDGGTFTMAEIVGLLLVNRSTAQQLTVGPHATNGCACFWADVSDRNVLKAALSASRPSFLALFCDAGFTVTAGSADVLAVINGSGSAAEYDLMLLGRSA